MKNIRVKCDRCDWEKYVEGEGEFIAWHNMLCPQCGLSVILTDADVQLYQLLTKISCLEEELFPGQLKQYHYRIDTAPLRVGKPMSLKLVQDT